MSVKVVKGGWCEDFFDAEEYDAITNNVAKDTFVIWAAAGVNGTAGSDPGLSALAGVANNAATVGGTTKALVTPLVSGAIIETQYQTGTPAIGDEVFVYSGTQINKVATTEKPIGRVIKVINASTSAATENGVSIPARDVLVRIY